MMKPSCLPVPARIADGPVSAALTRGVAWREDAAGDIRSRIAEATLLLQHHPAAHTLTQVVSWPMVVNALKTSAKGTIKKDIKVKKRNLIHAPILV